MRRKNISSLSLVVLAVVVSFALCGTSARAESQSPITYHGGPVMSSDHVNVYFIWYGNWKGSLPGSDILTQMILTDLAIYIGQRPRFNINSTYSDGNGNAANSVIFGGMADDAYSHGTTLSVSDIQEVIANRITARWLPADPVGIYVVMASPDVTDKRPDGTNFCAPDAPPYHGVFSYNGEWMKYAFVGNPERCPATAGAQFIAPDGSRLPTPNTNFAGDVMASSLMHALDTTLTDPFGNAWFDDQGKENADKCQGTFGKTYLTASGARANMSIGGRDYLIQQNWVNQQLGYCALSIDNAPVASDQSVSTNKDTPKTLTPTASDADGDTLLYRIVTQPQHGTLTGADTATLTYTPSPNYTGTDSFTFKADDGKLESNVATVSITVTSPISALDGFDPNANGTVRAAVVQPDGKILIGGDFTSLAPNGGPSVARYYIARLNTDGTLDVPFNPGTNTSVYAIALQPDGKILVGGQFTMVSPNGGPGVTRNDIARLNADGTLDTTFDPNMDGDVNAISVQADGKILVGGYFPDLAPNGGPGVTRNRIARLNADGTVDTSFDPNVNNGKSVRTIAVQADGKILIGGDFTSLAPNGGASVRRNNIARVNPDGTLDASFDPNANAVINAIALQADGKILVGGGFTALRPNDEVGFNRNYIARLNTDGTVDTPFNANPNASVRAVAVQADGKILIGGGFTAFGGLTRNHMARLNSVGSVEVTFIPNPNSDVYAISVQADGKILAGGSFNKANPAGGQTRNRIMRLEADGRLDQTLNLNTVGRYASTIAVQPDGKILIGGVFSSVLGVTRNNIARLNSDGTLDTAFNPNANDNVVAIVVQPDGKILIGGAFTTLAPGGAIVTRHNIARLNTDGTVDTTFDPNTNGSVNAISVQADGKIILGGFFTALAPNGGPSIARHGIARLNAGGAVDEAFDANPNSNVYAIALQADGKILIGGAFTTLAPNGGATVTRNRIARLEADGTLDTAFDPYTNNRVLAISVQADGKILIGGDFTSIAPSAKPQFPRNYIARLNADGTVDTAFNQSADDVVEAIALQADGKILIGGDFTSLTPEGGPTVTRNRIARLNADGTLDVAFAPSASDGVFAIALQADGKILVGGESGSIGGQMFARLTNDTAAIQNLSVTPTSIAWTRSGAAPQPWRVIFEQSADGISYTFLGNGTRVGATNDFTLTGLNLPTQQNLYIRARGFYREGGETNSESVTESVRNVFLLPAWHLAFSQQPTNTAVESAITPPVTVQILDASNNLVNSSASVTVGIGTNPSSGALSGTTTVAAVNGTATFDNLSINKLGTGYTLTASSADLRDATSDLFNITVGPPSSIRATAGSGQSANVSSTFATALQAAVTDAQGNPVSGVSVTFTAPASGAGGTFAANALVQTDISGIATAPAFTANGIGGSYIVTASLAGVSPSATFTLTNNKIGQTITFGALANKSFGDADFTISATASSGLPVSFAASGDCTVTGDSVHLTGAGSCTITASQPGSSSYEAAANVSQSFQIAGAATTVALSSSLNPSTSGESVTFNAAVSSAAGTPTGAVSFMDGGSAIAGCSNVALTNGRATCSVSNLTAGDHNIKADYSGDSNFLSASGTLAGGQRVNVNSSISVNDVSLAEGDSGTKSFSFTVTLSEASNLSVKVDFSTADGTATAGSDYQSAVGTLTFAPGEIEKTVTVLIQSDTLNEANETFFVNLSNAINATIGDNQGIGTILNDDSPGVQFSANTFTFSEGEGHGDVIVTRSGDLSSAIAVDYLTSDQSALVPCQTNNTGAASERCDYATAAGTLQFAAGEAQKTIPLVLINDAYIEGPEQLSIKLSNPQGASLGSVELSTVTITDNDTQVATENPVDNLDFFVRELYIDFLGREPEPAGLQFWKTRMTSECPAGQQCDRVDTAYRFFQSDEFRERGYFVYLFYHASLGRRPTYSEWVFDVAKLNGPKTVPEQEASKARFIEDFMSRQEFMDFYQGSQTGQTFVDALVQKSGIAPVSRQQLIDNYQTVGRAKTLRAFLETPEVQAAFMDRAFIAMLYYGFLRRDAEAGGFDFWMQKLESTNHDNRFLIGGFLQSDEYRFRFAQLPLSP